MEALLGLLGITLVVALVVIPILAIVAYNRTSRLQADLDAVGVTLERAAAHALDLEQRLQRIEAGGVTATAPDTSTAVVPIPDTDEPPAQTVATPPDVTDTPATTPVPDHVAVVEPVSPATPEPPRPGPWAHVPPAAADQTAPPVTVTKPVPQPVPAQPKRTGFTPFLSAPVLPAPSSAPATATAPMLPATADAATTEFSASPPPPPVQPPSGGEPPDPVPAPQSKRGGFEQEIGSRWAVWVGGFTLALGAIFLVKYSIEQGVFGPRARIALAALFSAGLFAAGEVLRRIEARGDTAVMAQGLPSIPAILTAAGAIGAFATSYGAHVLYDMIPATVAFGLMGAVGLLTLGASLMHGPALAALGLIGSYATPALVGDDSGSATALVVYLSVVGTAAFVLFDRKRAEWIATGALIGAALWALFLIMRGGGPYPVAVSVHLVVTGLLAAVFGGLRRPAADRASLPDPVTVTGLGTMAVLTGLFFLWREDRIFEPVIVAAVLGVLMTACGLLDRRSRPLLMLTAVLALGQLLCWPSGATLVLEERMLAALRLKAFPLIEPGLHLAVALGFAALLLAGSVWVLLARRPRGAQAGQATILIAFTGALSPVAIFMAVAVRRYGLDRNLWVAVLAAGLLVLLAALSEVFWRRGRVAILAAPAGPRAIASGGFAAGAAVSLGLVVAFAAPRLWLAFGFGVSAAAIAWLTTRRPLPILRDMAGVLASATVVRAIASPVLFDVEGWPVLNDLLVAWGAPAALFALGGYWLGQGGIDRRTRLFEVLSTGFALVCALLLIRHGVHGRYWYNEWPPSFSEVVLLVVVLAVLSALARSGALLVHSRIYLAAMRWLAVGSAAVIVLGLWLVFNPLLDGSLVEGPPIANRIIFGYGAATLAMAGLVLMLGLRRPFPMTMALAGIGVLTLCLMAVLEIRHLFHGPDLADGARVFLTESGVYSSVPFVTLGLIALLERKGRIGGIRLPMDLLLFVALGLFAGMSGLIANPVRTGVPLSGPPLADSAVVGVLLPTLALGALLWLAWARFGTLARLAGLAGLAIGALSFLVIEVRHLFHGPEIVDGGRLFLTEAGVYALLPLAALAALVWLRGRGRFADLAIPLDALLIGALALFVLLPGYGGNPLHTRDGLTGPPLLDSAFVGYALPTLALAVLLLIGRSQFGVVARGAGVAGLALGGLAFVLLEVRRFFVGPALTGGLSGDGELYAYSIALLGYGVALMTAGFIVASNMLRLAGLGIIALAVLKAFLIDMQGLAGVWRALSFMGLGLVLVAIGLVYQRFLARKSVATG